MSKPTATVTIPSSVADVIERIRSTNVSNEFIVVKTLDNACITDMALTLRSIPFDTLLSALVNGYDREKTEAERHAELLSLHYANLPNVNVGDAELDNFSAGIIYGIEQTLSILGITVVGINENKSEVSANV